MRICAYNYTRMCVQVHVYCICVCAYTHTRIIRVCAVNIYLNGTVHLHLHLHILFAKQQILVQGAKIKMSEYVCAAKVIIIWYNYNNYYEINRNWQN